MAFIKKAFKQERVYDKLALIQMNAPTCIFVNLCKTDKMQKPNKILSTNYFTETSFKTNFGVDFEEVLLNYFKIYAEKHNIEVTFDDTLITLIYMMKFLIKNRDKETEDYNIKKDFTEFCRTPYTDHLRKQEINPFDIIEVGPGYVTPHEINYTYIGIKNFIFQQQDTTYKIFFRY